MDESHARELLGPYLLGGLSSDEERELEEHLDSCPGCRAELAELREAHEFLNEPSYSPPPELKERVLSQVVGAAGEEEATHGADDLGRVTRRRRRLVKGVATPLVAAGLLVAAFLLGGMFSGELPYPGGPVGEGAALSPTGLATGSGGELRVVGSGSNYDVELEVWDLPEPEGDGHYELWFVDDDGRMSAGTFRVSPEGRTSVSLSVPATARSYGSVGITREPGDGDPAPSGEKVLGAELPEGWKAA